MPKADLTTIPEWFHKYVKLVKEDDASEAMRANTTAVLPFLQSIPEEKWTHRYAEGKWSIKEVVQHLIDAERIFDYRALCIARGETVSLPGFDENTYAEKSKAHNRSKEELIEELKAVREGTEKLFASLDDEQLSAKGISNNNPITVNGLGYIIPGHVQHHVNILKERYL
ncbi:DinB family protein [Flavisolibacter ginsenosidimutans]|uniref:DinB family protein n=1 Tax=Flavisolibacter ginsenosidimutans TaxID=661481 RepID=A0A5B8UDV3_9BACT|nr:DinB family protein [Flavisolibacter ginsenosidimutans]QEC54525.1 DinB family protein [Flavisolibacter ginsenosidimutans]